MSTDWTENASDTSDAAAKEHVRAAREGPAYHVAKSIIRVKPGTTLLRLCDERMILQDFLSLGLIRFLA
ncbi:MAG: hypothetical protein DMG97_14870 [Acidobacteria bacterium]|nr:MAG: hypothetical protein DMG97_14870 [Acidobacteriota bacterium]